VDCGEHLSVDADRTQCRNVEGIVKPWPHQELFESDWLDGH
jgi:hypothetical protein